MHTSSTELAGERGVASPFQQRRWLLFGTGLAALLLLYASTVPGNHTEAEDSLWYAYDVRTKPYHALFHIHHLLYLPVMHLIYTAIPGVDAYHLLIGIDILCAVATVGLLFGWLRRGLRLGLPASLFGCLFLAFCYGFWRYADEAEVYLPALVLMTLLAWRVFRRAQPLPAAETWRGGVLTALLGAVSMLMHAPLSTPLAVVAVPVYLLLTRRWRTFLVYGGVATVLVTGAYYTAYQVERAAHDPALPAPATFSKFLAEAGGESPLSATLSDFPKSAVGLGPDVVASSYLFAIPEVREKLLAAFPTRNFSKELYTAKSYGLAHAYVAVALALTLLMLLLFAAVARVKWHGPRLRALLAWPETIALLLWLAAYVVIVGVVEPENPENWICFLLPLAGCAALVLHFLYRQPERAWLPWAFVGLLLTHNLFDGLFIVRSPESDFFRHKGAWVIAHTQPGDVVFTRDNFVFTRFVRYYSPAQVVNVEIGGEVPTRAAIADTPAGPGGSRYLFVDVLEPPDYLRRRDPALYDGLAPLRDALLPVLVPTGDPAVERLPDPTPLPALPPR